MQWIPELQRVYLVYGIDDVGYWLAHKYRFTNQWLWDIIADYDLELIPVAEMLAGITAIYPAEIPAGTPYERQDNGLTWITPDTAYLHEYSLQEGYVLQSDNILIVSHNARYSYTEGADRYDNPYTGGYPLDTVAWQGRPMLSEGGFPDSWEYNPPASCYDVGQSTYPYSAQVRWPFCQYLAPESSVARDLVSLIPDGSGMGVFDSRLPDYVSAEGEAPHVTWLNNLIAAGYSGQVVLQGGNRVWRACGMRAIPLNMGYPIPDTGVAYPGYDTRIYSPVSGVGTAFALAILGRKMFRPVAGLLPYLRLATSGQGHLTIDGEPLTIDGEPLVWS